MRRQLLRDRFDSPDDAAFEIARFEIGLHRPADFLPARSANLGVDAAIGDNLDLAVGQQQIDQHAVVVGGVPDAQVRENIQRALPRGLIPEQRFAIQGAFYHKPNLAGMRGLTRLDRLLDRSQYLRRENPPYPPAVLNKMLAEALDAHIYQLPDPPPPPKLPPPPLNPPLSLQLLLPANDPPAPDQIPWPPFDDAI